MLPLKVEEGGGEPRNSGNLSETEGARRGGGGVLLEPPEGRSPLHRLRLGPPELQAGTFVSFNAPRFAVTCYSSNEVSLTLSTHIHTYLYI